ncbi:MAG: glutamate-5-semialdehyde dehydrogenase [Nitritalea sp.]
MTNTLQTLQRVKIASKQLSPYADAAIVRCLRHLAQLLVAETAFVLEANRKDLERMPQEDPRYDRLLLTAERIASIAASLENVALLPSPVGRLHEQRQLPNGLRLEKVSVPLGVIGVIYEARPNVTIDVFALALRSGNALILKGGSDAQASNQALFQLIQTSLKAAGLPVEAFALLGSARTETTALLEAEGLVDIVIPRGSQGLIQYVRTHAKVPVIETGAGIVHTYWDASLPLEEALPVLLNAKTRRPSVCNSLDCILLDSANLPQLSALIQAFVGHNVTLYLDARAWEAYLQQAFRSAYVEQALPEHFGCEFLSLKLLIHVVEGVDSAIAQIDRYSSRHSEAILSHDAEAVAQFLTHVDAAAVYVNTSTAFTDGEQFGLGAEIGISTQKLHARGPMGLEALCSYKWQVFGSGQVRE